MAISLSTISSGYNVSAINTNFNTLLDFVNNSAVWRTGSTSGETTMSRDLDMNSYKIINYKTDVTDSTSLITVGAADSRYYNVDGDTLTGTMQVNSQQVLGLPTPTSSSQAVPKNYVDTLVTNEATARRSGDAQIITDLTNLTATEEERYKALYALLGQVLAGTYTILGEYSKGPYTVTSQSQVILHNGYFLTPKDSTTLPYTTTGTTDATWLVDEPYFNYVGNAYLEEALIEDGVFGTLRTETEEWNADLRNDTKLAFGDRETDEGFIKVDSSGIVKSGGLVKGKKTGDNLTAPYTVNTGNLITTTYGTFPEKQVFFPSHNYEDVFTSPSLGITYSSAGVPSVAVISPSQTLSGSASWPDQTREGKTFWNLALADNVSSAYSPLPSSFGISTSLRYIQIAKWKVTSTPYNTELKLNVNSSNTSDNFVGTVTLEANIQSSTTTFATTSNLTIANLTKYIKVRFDGPRDRMPLASATSGTIPTFGCTADGTYLYLYLVLPASQSSPKLTQTYLGTGSAITVDYTGATVVTTAPSGIVYVPVWNDYNGSNTSVGNDGALLASDNHVRICNSSGSYSSRTDIAADGFLWGGYGTYKSNRQSCTITKSSTGVYVVTGPHNSSGWTLRQPRDASGEQVAIAKITASSTDGLTNTITVYAIKYTYDSTAGTVTRGVGDVMDIPTGSWVDFHASTTF